MNKLRVIQTYKVLIVVLLFSANQFAMASFTGFSNKKSESLYSLKNFKKNFAKNASAFSLNTGFHYKGVRFLSQKKEANGTLSFNSMMRFENGNTTYIYPYSHKVSVPKFKTPAPPASFR